MSHPTGINYFCQNSVTNTSGNLLVGYFFTGWTGNNIIPSLPFAKTKYSGFIDNTGNFYRISGSGYFDGNTSIRVDNASGLSSNTWTMIIDYELSGNQHGVLFSNYSSGAINSGWVLGISNLCSPYIEYYSNQGPQILLSSNTWGTRNTIFVTKTNSNITLDYLNYNTKQLESEQFSIDPTYFLPSNKWYIGASTGTPGYYSGNKFQGFIDYFLYFAPALLPSQKLSISSGLYCNINNPIQYVNNTTGYIVTGQTTGLVAVFSGTTGAANVFYQYLVGDCGSLTAVYSGVDLTGIVYDIGTVPLTQTYVTSITGITGGGPIENSGYSRARGMDAVSYLKNVDVTDLTEIFYFPTTVNKTNVNNTLPFDRTLNKFILPEEYTTNQINFYINSVNQFGSGYSVTGDFYNLIVEKSGMFFVSGNYLSGDYDGNDTNIIDFISGRRVLKTGNYFIDGTTTGISGLAQASSFIFVNGQKLKLGLDYHVSSTDMHLNNPYWYEISGNYWSVPYESNTFLASGLINNTGLSMFPRRTTMVFMNGMRQNINNDYVELSNFSLLNNSGRYLDDFNMIYNNGNTYFESI